MGLGRGCAQAGDLAVLGLTEEQRLGAREDQRVARCQVRPGERAERRLVVGRQRRVPMLAQRLGIQLDHAGGRLEAALFVLAVDRLQRQADSLWGSPQLVEADAAGRELMLPGRLDIAAEELLAQPQRDREVEDDPRSERASPRGATKGRRNWTVDSAS